MKLTNTLKISLMAAFVAFPALAHAQAYGNVATETLNVREGAKIESGIVEQIGLGEPVEIVSEQNGWLKIILEDDKRAYVKSEFINVHRVLAVVDVNDGLNVRDYPSAEIGKIIGRFSAGDELSVEYRVGDWYKVNQEGFEGYVSKEYIKNNSQVDFLSFLPNKKLTDIKRMTKTQEEVLQEMVAVEQEEIEQETVEQETIEQEEVEQETQEPVTQKPAQKPAQKPVTQKPVQKPVVQKPAQKPVQKPVVQKPIQKPSGTSGQAVVEYAKQFLGNPYVYGGNSLTNGVDCSGFTSQIMRRFGVSLNRSSSAQYANNGYAVSRNQLQAGDLMFYGYSGRVSHVAIYMGGGQIIHANDERTGICIGNAFPSRGKQFIGAKRVL